MRRGVEYPPAAQSNLTLCMALNPVELDRLLKRLADTGVVAPMPLRRQQADRRNLARGGRREADRKTPARPDERADNS